MSDADRADHTPDPAAEPDAKDRIAALLDERGGDDPDAVGDVPAGGAGADSGGAGAVRVDPASKGEVKDESIHNDEPGIGTRRSGD
ncbi:hypothetical protein [Microbacterium sp. 1.5R]|uniref:hypothetical protein n=1 Tax=Microbacterium sp. 1.5R TaxID=1916917 RepID=UPI00119CC2C3|nr:hypothetical protein [Microbacterium sp. 1.5R]